MREATLDLTRTDGGGCVIATRLPSDVQARMDAATVLVDRAVVRWALAGIRADVMAALTMLLEDQTDVEPLDMSVGITSTVLTLKAGSQMVPLSLIPASRQASAA